MAAATCYCDGIKHLEEVIAKVTEQSFGGAFFRIEFNPLVIDGLSIAEYLIDATVNIQFGIDIVCTPFVSQLKLVFKVIETIVHRRSTQHQHFGLDSLANHAVHQPLVTVLLMIGVEVLFFFIFVHIAAVAEVVAFIYHYKVVITPVDMLQIKPIA